MRARDDVLHTNRVPPLVHHQKVALREADAVHAPHESIETGVAAVPRILVCFCAKLRDLIGRRSRALHQKNEPGGGTHLTKPVERVDLEALDCEQLRSLIPAALRKLGEHERNKIVPLPKQKVHML